MLVFQACAALPKLAGALAAPGQAQEAAGFEANARLELGHSGERRRLTAEGCPGGLMDLTLMLRWIQQAQFAGYGAS